MIVRQRAEGIPGRATRFLRRRHPPPLVASAPMMSCADRSHKMADAQPLSLGRRPFIVPSDPGNERYDGKDVSPVHLTRAEPVSTFSIDVDTGAYANARRFLTAGQLPPQGCGAHRGNDQLFPLRLSAARSRATPFSVTTDVAVDAVEPATAAAAHRPARI